MKKKDQEGHEAADTIVDPHDLDEEAFLKERDKLLSGQGSDDTEDGAGTSLEDKKAGDTGPEPPKGEGGEKDKGTPPDTPLDAEGGQPSPDDKKKAKEEGGTGEPEPFTLEDKKEGGAEPGAEDAAGKSFLEIVHNGQMLNLTREEAVRRAQMGTDYESKMRQLAPYRRLIQVINTDKKLADLVTRYFQNQGNIPEAQPAQPAAPKLKPLKDYEGDDAAEKWLQDNIIATVNAMRDSGADAGAKADTGGAAVPGVSDREQGDRNIAFQVAAYFSMNDPQNFDNVFPEMVRRFPTLTQQDLITINNKCAQGDFRPIAKFYNYVKDNIVLKGAKAAPSPAANAVPSGGGGGKGDKFRVLPGGGSAPKETSGDGSNLPDAFSISEADFQKTIAKAKGHG